MTRWRAVPEVIYEEAVAKLGGNADLIPSPADDDAEVERIARLIRQEVMIADGYTREQALHDEDALWFHFKPAAIAVLRAMGVHG